MPSKSETLDTIWEVDDDLWAIIEPILREYWPPKPTGRKPANWRKCLNGIIFQMRTGCQWNQLPKEFGDDSTVHRWFSRWSKDGVFEKIWAILIKNPIQLVVRIAVAGVAVAMGGQAVGGVIAILNGMQRVRLGVRIAGIRIPDLGCAAVEVVVVQRDDAIVAVGAAGQVPSGVEFERSALDAAVEGHVLANHPAESVINPIGAIAERVLQRELAVEQVVGEVGLVLVGIGQRDHPPTEIVGVGRLVPFGVRLGQQLPG